MSNLEVQVEVVFADENGRKIDASQIFKENEEFKKEFGRLYNNETGANLKIGKTTKFDVEIELEEDELTAQDLSDWFEDEYQLADGLEDAGFDRGAYVVKGNKITITFKKVK